MSIMATEGTPEDGCRICRAPARDQAYYCDPCRDKLDRALGDITWVSEEIDISITRQKGSNINGGSRSAETPLPWHDKASEAGRHLHDILVSWVKFCTDETVRGAPNWIPRDNLPSLSRWLLHCTHGLSLHEIGPDAYEEITKAVSDCERIIFWKRRNRIYLGPCRRPVVDEEGGTVVEACPGEVYAEEGQPVGNCDSCGQGVTVVVRQAELNDELDRRLCTAAELARICVFLGLDVPRNAVRKKVHYWHRHKLIDSPATAPNGDPMFRYGEVRMRLYTEFSEKVKS
jgi:hypothetical protein